MDDELDRRSCLEISSKVTLEGVRVRQTPSGTNELVLEMEACIKIFRTISLQRRNTTFYVSKKKDDTMIFVAPILL